MNRSPLKSDGGYCFFFCLAIQLFLQCLLFKYFILVGFFDYGMHAILIKQAGHQGYDYEFESGSFTPELEAADKVYG